jgi:hypothetical protein
MCRTGFRARELAQAPDGYRAADLLGLASEAFGVESVL